MIPIAKPLSAERLDYFLNKLTLPPQIEQALVKQGALSISISGGADSHAMLLLLRELCQRRSWMQQGLRVCIHHADLHESDWEYTPEMVQRQAEASGYPLHVVSNRTKRSLIELWQGKLERNPARIPFSSAQARDCTSDMKVRVINSDIIRWVSRGVVVCAVGIRREESPRRRQAPEYFERAGVNLKSRKRMGYTWHPLLYFTKAEVFEVLGYSLADLQRLQAIVATVPNQAAKISRIRELDTGLHPAYLLGSTRMSCSICALGSQHDIEVGAVNNVEYLRSLVELEIKSGFAFQHKKYLGVRFRHLLTLDQQQRFDEMIERGGSGEAHDRPQQPDQGSLLLTRQLSLFE